MLCGASCEYFAWLAYCWIRLWDTYQRSCLPTRYCEALYLNWLTPQLDLDRRVNWDTHFVISQSLPHLRYLESLLADRVVRTQKARICEVFGEGKRFCLTCLGFKDRIYHCEGRFHSFGMKVSLLHCQVRDSFPLPHIFCKPKDCQNSALEGCQLARYRAHRPFAWRIVCPISKPNSWQILFQIVYHQQGQRR